jgi:phenylalanyl-tRNA synthetase beta chain
MTVTYKWLCDFLDLDLRPGEIEQLLTGCGLEVEHIEEVESIKGGLKGLVVGEVLTCIPHPNADKLRVTTVNIGGEHILQVVCGAPNVAPGQKVIVATIGTQLYAKDGAAFNIEKSKIRGEFSEGMICAEDEIGLGESHDGIMVLPHDTAIGTEAATYFNIQSDYVFEIGLTANRGDAASHLGVARDLGALLNKKIKLPEITTTFNGGDQHFYIQIDEPELCNRYSGIAIKNISVKESPDWLKTRLKAIGLNPINNVVDCTNYVLHELGQPLHAFDSSAIKGNKIIIKKAEANASFVTLDAAKHNLNGGELMIYNEREPMALAGVFGGLDSGVKPETKNIFIESAYFNPAYVRKTAKSLGLSTDSSFRFERGTDPDITIFALKRVASLIIETAGGEIASEIYDTYPNPILPAQVTFSISRFTRLIGKDIAKEEIKNILQNLYIKIIADEGDVLTLEVPAFKSDVLREADVAEEILRIYGLNNIEFPSSVKINFNLSELERDERLTQKIGNYLSSQGFYEAMNNSLQGKNLLNEEEQAVAVNILNPLSTELDVMRQSLIPGLLQSVSYNRNRRMNEVKLYEFGSIYTTKGNGKFKEQSLLSIISCGNIQHESWYEASKPSDFYYIKSLLENICSISNISCQFEASSSNKLDECWIFTLQKNEVARMGYVRGEWLNQYDINVPVMYAEINMDRLADYSRKPQTQYKPVPKFPAVRRDLALLIDEQLNYAEIEKVAKQTERKLLRDMQVFDVYKGDKIEQGKKSYAVSFHFIDEEKTLQEDTIEKTMKRLSDQLEKQLGAKVRGA